METYVVKEIREYEESILMGLNKRQLLCSVLAILSAVGMYFGLRRVVGTEIIGWLCILVAIPSPRSSCPSISFATLTTYTPRS